MSIYSASSFLDDKKNVEYFNAQQRGEEPPPSYTSATASSSNSSQGIGLGGNGHENPLVQTSASFNRALNVGPEAIPSPVNLVVHFVKLERGKYSFGWGENLYSLALAPEHAPEQVIYEYIPDVSKDSSSGSHRATLSALRHPIFQIHVSGDWSISGPFSGEIDGMPGPHSNFKENGKYKPFKKEDGVDKYFPICRVLEGENTDVQVARFCARILSSLLNPNALTGSKAIRPSKIAPTGSYISSSTSPYNPGQSSTGNNYPSTSFNPAVSGHQADQSSSHEVSSSYSNPYGNPDAISQRQPVETKPGFFAQLKEEMKGQEEKQLTVEERLKRLEKEKKKRKQGKYAEAMASFYV